MGKVKNRNLAVEVKSKKDITIYESPESASKATGLSVNSIKIRCNKCRAGSDGNNDKIFCRWVDDSTFRSFQAKKSKKKGSSYELKIIHELTDLGFPGLKSSRSENRNLDGMKIDVADTQNVLDCYIQAKATASTPNISKINKEVGLKDKPLAIFWNRQNNSSIMEEFVIIPKDYFYMLLKRKKCRK